MCQQRIPGKLRSCRAVFCGCRMGDEQEVRAGNGVCRLQLCLIALAGLRHLTGYSRKHGVKGILLSSGEREPA